MAVDILKKIGVGRCDTQCYKNNRENTLKLLKYIFCAFLKSLAYVEQMLTSHIVSTEC